MQKTRRELLGAVAAAGLAASQAQGQMAVAKYARFRKGSSTAFGVVEGETVYEIRGDLFGARTRDDKHQELIFFLRPTVLTNTAGDNVETFKRVDALPTRNEIRQEIDPNFVPSKESIIQKILK